MFLIFCLDPGGCKKGAGGEGAENRCWFLLIDLKSPAPPLQVGVFLCLVVLFSQICQRPQRRRDDPFQSGHHVIDSRWTPAVPVSGVGVLLVFYRLGLHVFLSFFSENSARC